MNQLVFLSGASGSQDFWQPLLAHLKTDQSTKILAYPGFDGVEPNSTIQNLYDLQEFIAEQIEDDSILVAQSMGGVLAVGIALHHPQKVKGLVLLATSGGLDLSQFGCADWRIDYREQFKAVPDWFLQDQTEFSLKQLSSLEIPVLLIWGDQDALSTVKVGKCLKQNFKHANLHIIKSGDHFFAATHPVQVAELIEAWLESIEWSK
ncbi:alpha/beta fold hydrolase [Acinetobacter sp. YH16031]|uniref:alpha/beta fold hydrolase n=1 Tax=Acinetobacter sp. YH16031 TaxID=2601180 RepID=UPI0015D1887F|nr:alpha/beta hydrolase [Acinetobacter sp. YH16031]